MCARCPSAAFIVSSVVLDIAAVPQVVAVDVRRMRQVQFVHRLDEGRGRLQRRELERIDFLIDVRDVLVALALPEFVAARVDQLHAGRPRRP